MKMGGKARSGPSSLAQSALGLLFAVWFLSLAVACASASSVAIGKPAPPFSLRDLRGQEMTLSKLRGKVVLLNFWATWCGPCRAEMPSMEALYRSFKRADLEILALSMDRGDETDVRTYVNEFGFQFPILSDNRLAVSALYQVRMVPSSFLIDRNQFVRHRIIGARDWTDPDLREIVSKLVSEKG